jgi:hypothetical protein
MGCSTADYCARGSGFMRNGITSSGSIAHLSPVQCATTAAASKFVAQAASENTQLQLERSTPFRNAMSVCAQLLASN